MYIIFFNLKVENESPLMHQRVINNKDLMNL
jgi:hypothetical protein